MLMKYLKFVLLFIVLCFVLLVLSIFIFFSTSNYTVSDNPSDLVLKNGFIFNGTNELIKNDLLIISNSKIKCIGLDCSVPEHAKIFDLADNTILPGLIDLHIHFNAISKENTNYSFPRMIADFMKFRPQIRKKLQEYGITSIRSVGDTRNEILNLKKKISNNELEGPRTFITGPIFTAPNGHPAGTIYKGNSWLIDNGTIQVTDPLVAKNEVEKLANQDVDGIKLVYDNGSAYKTAIPRLELEVMKAIVDEAKKHNLWIAAHTGSIQEVKEVIEAGVTTIEHGIMSIELIDSIMLKELQGNNVTYIPTLAVQKSIYKSENEERFNAAKTNAYSMYKSGIAIGAGTDTQGKDMEYGKSLIDELKFLVESGIPVFEAINSATINAAKALSKEEELGKIKENYFADLMVVSENPIQNIEALERVKLVVQNGRIVYEKN